MANIKLTPFTLFLFILIILVISVLLSNWLPLNQEGMIAFHTADAILTNNVVLPQYSLTTRLTKLYDNVYFDQANANTIFINGTQYSTTIDNSGTSITYITIIPRNAARVLYVNTKYDSNHQIIPSTDSIISNKTVASSYESWQFPVAYFNQPLIVPYQIMYIPWNDSTFVHVLDISSTNVPVASYLFGSGNVQSNYTYQSADIPTNMPTTVSPANVTTINTYIKDLLYDVSQTIYAISDYVKFDTKNGNLIIQTGTGTGRSLTIYGNGKRSIGTGTTQTPYRLTATTISVGRPFTPFMVVDTTGQTIVLYMQMSNKTMIALLMVDPLDKTLYTLQNVVRFNSGVNGGVETANVTTAAAAATPAAATPAGGSCDDPLSAHDIKNAPSLESIISDYYKKYWYSSSNSANVNQYSDDFMLKTQMIPPICPACPACPKNTTCTNCGGNGGDGLNGIGNAIGGIADGIGDVAGGALSGAGALGGGALLGAGALGGGALLGAGALGGAIGDVAGGALSGAGALGGGISKGIGQAIGGGGEYGHDGYGQGGYGQGGYGQGGYGQSGGYDSSGKWHNVYSQGGYDQRGQGGYGHGGYDQGGHGGYGHGGGIGQAIGGVGNVVGGALYGAGSAIGGIGQGIGQAIGGLGQSTNVQSISSPQQGLQQQGKGLQQQGQGLQQQGMKQGSDPTRVGYYNGQSQNAVKGIIDPYSYNGALQSKGGDPLPVTSDFSKFGK